MNWNPSEHYQSQDVAAEYDKERFSSIPGRVFNYLEKRIVVKCFSLIPKRGKIVDLPCGTGRLAEALLSAGYRVHGVDISAAMLEVAKKRLDSWQADFTTQVADVRSLPSDRAIYDGALCARVLMHLPLDQQIVFLTNVAGLSRMTVVINHSLNSRYQRLRRRMKRLVSHQSAVRFPVSNEEIKVLLQKAGLREVKRYRLMPIVSEAVYIVAHKTPGDQDPGRLP